MNIKYCFRDTSCISGVDPSEAAEELARIHNEHGVLTPDNVLEVAEDEANPLHPAFEWDDKTAARRYRRKQAQELIYSVRVIREDGKKEPVYIHSQSCGGYKPTEEIVQRIDLYEEAYRKAMTRIGEAEHTLRVLEEIAQRHRPDSVKTITRAANAMLQVQRSMHEVA